MGQVETVDVLRSIAPDLLVIALTRGSALPARLRAFQHGADDVLVVPFASEELLARQAALARARPPDTGVLHVNGLEIDLLRRRARLAGSICG